MKNIRFAIFAISLLATVSAALASVSGECINASSFGWNAEDSTSALQAAFDSGAKRVVIDRQAGDWISRPLFITNSNIEVVFADGVTLKAKRGEFYGKKDCLIQLAGNISNVVLRGEGKATIRMNKADYHDPKQNYAHSEWRHAVSVLNAQNVTVRDLTILSSGGDGIYLNGPKGVLLENLVLRDHHRQGMSPINVSDMMVRRCSFNDTFGTAPNCGVDMEPNKEHNKFVNVVYEDCEFNGNAAHGIDLYFGHFTSRTAPVSITFRRCKAYGNKKSGLSFMTGSPPRMEKYGQVKGSVRFEDCEFANNNAEALKIFNHSTNGMDICFAGCIFDARGAKAESAIFFSNNRYLGDFGSLTFERCTVKLDEGRKVCMFEAQRGIGIGGRLSGTLAVERGEKREMFNLDAFAAKHVPCPEQVVRFKAKSVSFRKIKALSDNLPENGKFTPFVRLPFVYVVAVPDAGEYKIRFNSRKLRNTGAETLSGVVQLLDRVGTDLGKFDVQVGDFEYTLKSNGPNVYRFEVSQRNTAIIRMACDGAAGALLADYPVRLFTGKDEVFHFCVPANAEIVSAYINPDEDVQAVLIDSKGNTVAEMPYQRKPATFSVKRTKTASNEVWKLKFIKISGDVYFQIGADGIPLVSTDPNAVITAR